MSKKFYNMPWEEIAEQTYNKLKSKIKDKEDFINYFMERKDVGYCFDYFLIGQLYFIQRNVLDKNKDFVIVVVGREGWGKTTLGYQISSWLDPKTFNNDRICFEADEVVYQWRHSPPFSAIQIDEGGLMLFSREAMQKTGINIVKLFMTIRVKRFVNIICIPNYKNLDSYIKEHRVAMIIDIRRGYKYQGYIGRAIELINNQIKRMSKLSGIKVPNGTFWSGYFNYTIPQNIDIGEYEKKKLNHVNKTLDKLHGNLKEQESVLIPAKKVREKLGNTKDSFNALLYSGVLKSKKIGRNYYMDREYVENLLKNGTLNTPDAKI